MNRRIFISHIHEEAELAKLLKETIEEEFSGFVEVFASSVESSIPSGTNFLKRIESGLCDCIAAIYLLSPNSINRHWINFELGAVWIRSVLNERDGKSEIPTIPFCHSGLKPSSLPMPIINLNGIEGSSASQLENTFKSLQRAVGGRGSLRTDFNKLSNMIRDFEKKNTIEKDVLEFIRIIFNQADIKAQFLLFPFLAKENQYFRYNEKLISQDEFNIIKELKTRYIGDMIDFNIHSPYVLFKREENEPYINGLSINITIKEELALTYINILKKNS